LISAHMAHGHPTVTGFTDSYVMAAAFLAVCVVSGLLVPRPQAAASRAAIERTLAGVAETT
jgi:hypothetical protein